MLNRELMISLENKLHGFHTRTKELHFSASSYSLHSVIDEFDESLLKFEDEVMENMQALFEVIKPGELNPEHPGALDFKTLLEDLRGVLVNIKKELDNGMMYTGIINIIDDFFANVNKYIYLVNIINKE